ncbi:putative transcription factor [Zancudomyces culisetae]|uniref:Putative transcription factor n=1 Tax=Zancudomyces culisetae TaxID=1213189 RepID=A0A1R1PUG5_ZANCU|nr:putative transcription factor [Zancudomyces culisetae]|eukprot:OMH84594.1 putative transcription factor [Zancudomyces culisetae]
MSEKIEPGTTVFPVQRVRRIIKTDREVELVTGESVFLISKATELFVKFMATQSLEHCRKDKRKTIQYKDICKIFVYFLLSLAHPKSECNICDKDANNSLHK